MACLCAASYNLISINNPHSVLTRYPQSTQDSFPPPFPSHINASLLKLIAQNLPTTAINELQIGKSNNRGEEPLHQPPPPQQSITKKKTLVSSVRLAPKTTRPYMTKICDWGHRLRCVLRRNRVVTRTTDGLTEVPKGYLAVYVGKDGEAHRYLVPVIYVNHPFFEKLLREAEEEFGFHHAGGITIPCRKAKFETVRSEIAATRDTVTCPW